MNDDIQTLGGNYGRRSVTVGILLVVMLAAVADDDVSPECAEAIAEAEYALEHHPSDVATTGTKVDAAEVACRGDFEDE